MTAPGAVPALTGEPTLVSAPVLALMVYAQTLAEPELATYANLPEGSTVIDAG